MEEVARDLSPLLKVYKDGRVERLMGTGTVPPSVDDVTGVASSDVIISSAGETPLFARLYVPAPPQAGEQSLLLPVVVYFHGGAFVIESASSPTYHTLLNSLAAAVPAVVLSVDYRLAPEHPLPAAYDDALAALRWLLSAALPRADLARIFLAGDSAGANIAHRVCLTSGVGGIRGAVLVHPYFWGSDAGVKVEMVDELWMAAKPGSEGIDDPWINPERDPNLGKLGCGRVLVCVAEKDILKGKGISYVDALRRSAWGGTVEVVESEGEEHVFHLRKPTCDNASELMRKVCSFINCNDDA